MNDDQELLVPHIAIRLTSYLWKPQSDITAFELAQCLPFILAKQGVIRGLYDFDILPENCQRHFEVFRS